MLQPRFGQEVNVSEPHSPEEPEKKTSTPPLQGGFWETLKSYWETFKELITSIIEIVTAPLKMLQELVTNISQVVEQVKSAVPAETHLNKLQDVARQNPVFAQSVKELQETASLPTYQDADILPKVAQVIQAADMQSRVVPNMLDLAANMQDSAALKDFHGSDQPAQLKASQYFLHRFMQTSLHYFYPDYFQPTLHQEHQGVESHPVDRMDDLQRVVVSAETPEGPRYKGIRLTIPQNFLKELYQRREHLVGENRQELLEVLPERLQAIPEEAVWGMIALAMFDAQLQLARCKSFPDLPILEPQVQEEMQEAFEKIQSDDKAEWLDGVAGFAHVVAERMDYYHQRLTNGGI